MLPLWQFRPCGNFVQVQRCLVQFLQINRTLGGCVSKESAFESWSSRCEMDPCPGNGHSSAVSHQAQKLQVPIHINRKAFTLDTGHCRRWKFHFYSRLDVVGQPETSTGSVALPFGKEASIANHWSFYRRGQVRWCQQVIPSFVSCVRNSRFESAW